MIIYRLEMNNFRQYIGTQYIDFSTDQEKNVTVLIGTNTSGKTTIIRAFEWCLYGKNNFDDKVLLNSDVRANMRPGETQIVSVAINFAHDNKIYTLKRSLKYCCSERRKNVDRSIDVILSKNPIENLNLYYLASDGQTKTAIGTANIRDSIDHILPNDLSDYFFFGGERISNIANRADLTKAVRGLMRLNVLENALDHMKKVIKDFQSHIDTSEDEKARNIQNALETSRTKLKYCEKHKQEIDEELIYWKNKVNEYANELIKSNVEKVRQAQAKRTGIEVATKNKERELSVVASEMVKAFNNKPYVFFGMPAIKKSLEFLESVKESTESVPAMEQASIDFLLKRGFCICGTQLCPDTLAYKKVMNERKKLPPEYIGSVVEGYRQKAEGYLTGSETYLSTLKDKISSIRNIKRKLGELKDEYDEVSQMLINDTQVSELESKRVEARTKCSELEEDRAIANQDIGRCNADISNCQKSLDAYAKNSKKNKRIALLLSYSEAVNDWLSENYKNKEKKVREELQKRVNNNFSHMYHGERSIYIDEKYHVHYSDVKTEESEGLKAVRSFAFIASLVSMAKDKVIDDADMSFSQDYPIVMDAPFSNVDEIHIENICKILPKTANQIIMAVMQKDWDYAAKNLNQYVGRCYSIEKALDKGQHEIETITHIRPMEG